MCTCATAKRRRKQARLKGPKKSPVEVQRAKLERKIARELERKKVRGERKKK